VLILIVPGERASVPRWLALSPRTDRSRKEAACGVQAAMRQVHERRHFAGGARTKALLSKNYFAVSASPALKISTNIIYIHYT
jgi:hypothetical protein